MQSRDTTYSEFGLLDREMPGNCKRVNVLRAEHHRDRANWNRILSDFKEYDFGHTYDFHRISEYNGEGEAVIFAVRNSAGKYIACWPTLLREIEGTEFYDLGSVYGYSGPLINDPAQAEESISAIYRRMKEQGVISLFARLHPMFSSQDKKSAVNGVQIGNVVVIDVEKQKEAVKNYRSNHRRDIKKSIRAGVHTVVDPTCRNLDEFIRIYTSTMHDLEARDYYFFNRDYFIRLAAATEFQTSLVFSRFNEVNIGAILLIKTNNIMHYYLGGVDRNYFEYSPLKLMLATGHEFAISTGVSKFVLGGGPGGMDDSLIRFKKGFSDLVLPFCISKRIIDPVAYKEVCEKLNVDPEGDEFFPAYRALT